MRWITEAKDVHGKEKTLAMKYFVGRDKAFCKATNGAGVASWENQVC